MKLADRTPLWLCILLAIASARSLYLPPPLPETAVEVKQSASYTDAIATALDAAEQLVPPTAVVEPEKLPTKEPVLPEVPKIPEPLPEPAPVAEPKAVLKPVPPKAAPASKPKAPAVVVQRPRTATVIQVSRGYPIRGRWWSGCTSWVHLASGQHAGRFDVNWLKSLSYAELQSLHSDDHEGRVNWNYAVKGTRTTYYR